MYKTTYLAIEKIENGKRCYEVISGEQWKEIIRKNKELPVEKR